MDCYKYSSTLKYKEDRDIGKVYNLFWDANVIEHTVSKEPIRSYKFVFWTHLWNSLESWKQNIMNKRWRIQLWTKLCSSYIFRYATRAINIISHLHKFILFHLMSTFSCKIPLPKVNITCKDQYFTKINTPSHYSWRCAFQDYKLYTIKHN